MTGAWRYLPPLAIAVFALLVGVTIAVSGDTFGYDFAAYWLAARRLLDGEPLYDPTVQAAVGYGVYLYPPPAAVAFIPFALLPQELATQLWVGLMVAATVAAVALAPVPVRIRWLTLLLAGLMWPVVYAIKLGQITPLLFLLFAAAWRWLDRPAAVGGAGGVGAVLKLQPALLLVWALLSRRWRAVAVGAAIIAGAIVVTIPITGLQAYVDYADLLRRVSDPLDTPNNLSPGAVLYGLGVDAAVAGMAQSLVVAATLALVVITALRATPEAGLLVAIAGSQLASPVLWSHYAMILLLPVAWLLARRQWWAVAIPVAVAVPLVGATPPIVYPVAFAAVIVAVAALGLADARGRATRLP